MWHENLLPFVLFVCPACLSLDTPSAAVELLFSLRGSRVPYDLCAVWEDSTCDSRLLGYHNVSVNIKGETRITVKSKLRDYTFVVRQLSELSDKTELVTAKLNSKNVFSICE